MGLQFTIPPSQSNFMIDKVSSSSNSLFSFILVIFVAMSSFNTSIKVRGPNDLLISSILNNAFNTYASSL